MSTTINIRIDPKLKREAVKVFGQLGLTVSGAVKMYIADSIKNNNPVKPLKNLNKLKKELDREAAWALKHAKRYSSFKELFNDVT